MSAGPYSKDVQAGLRRYKAGGGGPKATLMVLADYIGLHDGEWSCWPGLALLAEESEQSLGTVRRHLASFEAKGLITTTIRGKEGGGRGFNAYVFDLTKFMPQTFQNDPIASDQSAHPDEAKRASGEGQSAHLADPVLSLELLKKKEQEEQRARRFARWWDRYPKRNGKRIGRDEAERIWNGLTDEEHHAAWVGIRFYAQACDAGLTLAKDPARWLKGRCWVDWQEPASGDHRPAQNGSAKLTNVEQGMANIDSIFEGLEHR